MSPEELETPVVGSELERFLEHQRGLGKVDSQGRFTIDLSLAVDKLRNFQLSDPSFYVLKVIQAGVSAGAEEVRVRLRAGEVEVLALGVKPDRLPLEGLLDCLDRPQDFIDQPEGHLAVGLNAALSLQPELLEWVQWAGDQGSCLAVTPEAQELTPLARPPVRGGEPVFRLRMRKGGSGGFFARLRERLDRNSSEHQAITRRCGYSPVPIYLDGVRVSTWGREQVPKASWNIYYPHHYRLAELYLVAEPSSGPCVSLTGPRRRSCEKLYVGSSLAYRAGALAFPEVFLIEVRQEGNPRAGVPQAQTDERLLCRAGVSIPIALQGSGQVIFVKAGVALDPAPVDLGCPGAIVVVPGDHIEADLSQFQPRKDQAFDQAVAEARDLVLELVAAFRSNRTELRWRLVSRRTVLNVARGAVGASSAWVVPTLLSGQLYLVPLGIPAALIGAFHAVGGYESKRMSEELRRKVLERLP